MKIRNFLVFLKSVIAGAIIFLAGCHSLILFDPKGPIGEAERFTILAAIVLMLIVVIPVFILAFLFARRFRASNTGTSYSPKWSYSAKIDLVMWLVPIVIVSALGYLAWRETYRLDPYKPLKTGVPPIRIEVVSLDWNWLFIYPEHHIAMVNQLVFPVKVPLSFKITSDTVMTSFFIPQLGSQIYAMAGMMTQLNLLAEEPGIYEGQNQQFSGRDFSDMHFQALALDQAQFETWIIKAKQSPYKLDSARYEELGKPSPAYPVTLFSWVQPGLFDSIIMKYRHLMANPESQVRTAGERKIRSGVSESR